MPEDKLIEVLESFDYPVCLQGSLADDEEYPETFFTFWNNETTPETFYDNDSHSETAVFDVNVYSTDPQIVYSLLRDAIEALKKEGFEFTDSGHSVASDVNTHTGRGCNAVINFK